MNIQKIQTSNSAPAFKAGKVRVFSDFDKTFLPSSHKNFVHNYDVRFVNAIREYFKNFGEFLKQTKEGLKFSITTGRTFGEFLTMAEVARERKFGMPLPDTLIVKNGSDEHIRVGTDEDFYKGGKFPFKYGVTNKEKENKIKQISSWDGAKVKQILKDVFKSYNFRIVEADSEHSVSDYGKRSLFAQGNLPFEQGKVFKGTNKADWSVGFRNDGNLKVFYTLPVDMFKVEERAKAYQDIKSKISERFSTEGIRTESNDKTKYVNGRPCESYVPQLEDEYGRSESLTKSYDVREAIKEATKNNDLVIVAGDSSNDEEMLNPGNYLKDYLTEDILKRHHQLLYKLDNPNSLLKELDKDPELADIFIKMPYRGIIVRQNGGENKLDALEPYAKGKYKKIEIVDEGKLQQGIKDSIKQYGEQNPKYKQKLSSDLKKQIEPDTSSTNRNKENDKDKTGGDDGDGGDGAGGNNNGGGNSNGWKYILGALGIIGIGGGGIYLWNKGKKKKGLKNDITNQHNSKSV